MIPPGADEIRAGVPADAPVLTRVAHAAKRHWGYPEEWIRTWCGDLTVTAEYIEHHPIYVAERAGWEGMTAVVNGDVRPVDDVPITRPGPRLAQGLASLARAIHPELELSGFPADPPMCDAA